MFNLNELICFISAISFAGYGFSCLFSKRMAPEFQRYDLAKLQKTIGILQILGSLGLLAGFYFSPLKMASSLGLSLMMLLAVLVRIKIKDSLIQTIPAFLFLVINMYIFLDAFKSAS